MRYDKILVLDFGGQYTQLIARRIRELSFYSEIRSYDIKIDELEKFNPNGIILSGGPSSVYDENSPHLDLNIYRYCEENEIGLLGICYGLHEIAYHYGGKIISHKKKEYGKNTLNVIQRNNPLFDGVNSPSKAWMSHGDVVEKLPNNFELLASSENCKFASFRHSEKQVYAVQFHPEVRHTEEGMKILNNFLLKICKCTRKWLMENFIQRKIQEIKEVVKSNSVIMGVSGGVDSSVAATLIHRAIGSKIHCIFVDNGLLRKGEVEEVKNIFQKKLEFENFHCIDASKLFLEKLKGITDPEEKRKVIGHTFIQVFEENAEKLKEKHGEIKFLGQGTIAPDRIESGATSNSSAVIKSHHNLTLPEKMKLQIIEPLDMLYKDEVRSVGRKLGIPNELINRHPFPGPSLAIRIIDEVTEEKLALLREADYIVIEEIKKAGIYNDIWQAFAAFLPVKSVGVMGDFRTYSNMILVRMVESEDAMTANFSKVDWDVLERISSRIINEVRGINRVVYDISNKPPSTIELQ